MIAAVAAATMTADWPKRPPGTPCNVSVTVSQRSAIVRWAPAPRADGGGHVGNFAVLWQEADGGSEEWSDEMESDASEFTLRGLDSGRAYGFRISAYNTQVGKTTTEPCRTPSLRPFAPTSQGHTYSVPQQFTTL